MSFLLPVALAILAPQGFSQVPGLVIELKDGKANLTVSGITQNAYAVQCTTNVALGESWWELTNFVLSAASVSIADPVPSDAGQMFYRAVWTHPAISVSNVQLQDMCSRLVDILAVNSTLPETITITASGSDAVTVAEMHYLMAKWLRHYRNNAQNPPGSVTITGGVQPPPSPTGIEAGTIYLADILSQAEATAGWIDATRALPNSSSVGGLEYATRAMVSIFARTINWYQDHAGTMPNYGTVRTVVAPASWPANALPPGLRVAVFSAPENGSTDAACIQATLSILSTNSGFSPTTISAASIRSGGLTNFDVVMFPGGSAGLQAQALEQSGCAKVAAFVGAGGGFVGTCAGAYLAALGYSEPSGWLDIVDASVIDVEHWNRGTGMAQVQIVDPTNVLVSDFPETITAWYVNGPLFGPGGSSALPDYQQIAVFISDICNNASPGIMPGTTCITASTYQLGRCVLFSFHPELTPGLEQLDVRAVLWAAREL